MTRAVVASSITIDQGQIVTLRQRGQTYGLGALTELSVASPWPPLPFGVGIPRIVGPTGSRLAIPLLRTPRYSREAEDLFTELLADARS